MLDGDLEWICDGGEIDLLIPPHEFSGMNRELAGLATVKVDIKSGGTFDNQIRPFFGADLHGIN